MDAGNFSKKDSISFFLFFSFIKLEVQLTRTNKKFFSKKLKIQFVITIKHIKNKMEYCCIVWSPVNQKWIYELEKIQKNFTKKIKGMEELVYHERLKKTKYVQS